MKHRRGFDPHSQLFAAYRVCAALFFFSVALLPASSPQAEQALEGVVVTADGKPLAGVAVLGSRGKRCCPFQHEMADTDEKGAFVLKHPGAVVHFSKREMQPLTLVVRPGPSQVRIVMTLANNGLTVPACVRADSHHKQIGWGKYGLHFAVPKAGVKILGGETDVDYVLYVIQPDNRKSNLSLWFGPYAMSSQPDDQQFVDSANFSQRYLMSSKGEAIGVDSRGQLNSGLNWRQTTVMSSGAIYKDADKDSAAIFDQIINSICTVDYPQK